MAPNDSETNPTNHEAALTNLSLMIDNSFGALYAS